MTVVTRNILYRRPVNFTTELPPELIYHVLSYLPARDLKTVRLVNRFLAQIGIENFFWSELCRLNWSEKLCLRTLPVPSPHIRSPTSSDDERDSDDEQEEQEDVPLSQYLLSMEDFYDHTYDELKPATLWDLATFFPAFKFVEGSWMRAYNLVRRNFSIPYLHASVRADHYAVSDTQWEFRFTTALRAFSGDPQNIIHAFLDYRRDYRLHIVHGVKHWDQPFHWRPLASGSAIRVQEFPPHELSRNSDGYRTMTNQWVCMTSTSEHSFVRDLGALSARLMRRRILEGGDEMDRETESFEVGERLLKWIEAYGQSPGNLRACWIGEKKKMKTTYAWRDDDSDDEDDD